MPSSTLEYTLVALRRIIRATESGSRELARRSGMSTSEVLTLQAVADNPGISPGELARTLGLSPVTSTVILQKLETKGFISKAKSPADKRRIQVMLTKTGQKETASAPSSLHVRFMEKFENLPPWEQHFLAAALGKVTDLLGASTLDAAPILDVGPLNK
ncbi:MAG: winged helix-turn-helix transcriptional regulator [Limnobacter sp.]|nr:winged helix-turn-helix transcriptional regulator [Limnobacter sp.]